MKSNKKLNAQVAGLSAIPAIAAALVIGFVFLAIGGQVMTTLQDNQVSGVCNATTKTGCTLAYNATGGGIGALTGIGNFGATMGLVAAAVVVLTLLAGTLGALVLRSRR